MSNNGPSVSILSGQMEPPPIKPVVEMNYVADEYEVYQEPVELNTLFYNASGPYEDIGLVPGTGITGLHNDLSNWLDYGDPLPPSIRGTQLLIDVLTDAMTSSGGLTAVCEFEVDAYEIWGANDQCPIFWFYRNSIFGETADADGEMEWQCYIESGVQGEGYFEDYVNPANARYQGGSAWEASNDRRYRMSGTWCFDKGSTAGVNRYIGGQSIDGQPQGIDVSFGETPYSTNNNLAFMDKITGAHFFGVGFDEADYAATGVDNGWWWWANGGWIIRYLAFYRARPTWTLAPLSKISHTPIRVGQVYTEVIHAPVLTSTVRMIPILVSVEPVMPKIGIVAHPKSNIDVIPTVPAFIGVT